MLLEVPLAGLAAYQPDEETLERLRAAVDAAVAAPDDPEVFAEADGEIHRTIAAASGNRMIQALTNWIFEVLQPSLIEVLQPAVVHSAIDRAARGARLPRSRRATRPAPSGR